MRFQGATRADPDEPNSSIRLLPWVFDGEALIGSLPYAVQRLGHAYPALGPVRALLVRVSLGPALGSTASATGSPALFGGFTATMAESDFSESCIGDYGSSPSHRGPSAQ